MAELTLAGGLSAVVDDADIEKVAGSPWRLDANGYAVFKVGRTVTYMHRVIASAQPGQVVDHVNGNRLDNRAANLRLCSHAQNMQNRKVGKNNKLGLKGVHLDRRSNRYAAEIKANGKRYRLGYFSSPEDAHAAYVAAAKIHHGAFANPGIP